MHISPAALGSVAIAVLVGTLAGCIVLPVPVHQGSAPSAESRTNIEGTAPQIVVGRTTRTQVLLTLGEPDGRADDDRWFSYRTQLSRGGWRWAAVWVGLNGVGGTPVGDWNTVRRLVVRFDDSGVVASVEAQEKNCNGCRFVLDAQQGD